MLRIDHHFRAYSPLEQSEVAHIRNTPTPFFQSQTLLTPGVAILILRSGSGVRRWRCSKRRRLAFLEIASKGGSAMAVVVLVVSLSSRHSHNRLVDLMIRGECGSPLPQTHTPSFPGAWGGPWLLARALARATSDGCSLARLCLLALSHNVLCPSLSVGLALSLGTLHPGKA